MFNAYHEVYKLHTLNNKHRRKTLTAVDLEILGKILVHAKERRVV